MDGDRGKPNRILYSLVNDFPRQCRSILWHDSPAPPCGPVQNFRVHLS
ncbi:CDHR1 isoform 5, partial [Pan troglodytes]